MTIEAKRAELRQRIAASRGRFDPEPLPDDSRTDKPGRLARLAGRHPLALIGGALTIGVVLGLSGNKRDTDSTGAPKGNGRLAAFLIDALFAIGIGLIEDVALSQVFDEDDEDPARARSASARNTLIRGAAGIAAQAGVKLRRKHGKHTA